MGPSDEGETDVLAPISCWALRPISYRLSPLDLRGFGCENTPSHATEGGFSRVDQGA